MKKKREFLLYGIFGYPLGHTLSPAMQEAAFEALGIRAHYLSLGLDRSRFQKVLRDLKGIALDGFNVTVPYKGIVRRSLKSLTAEARVIGAVNTVFRSGGRWVGANTDCDGFLTSLRKDAKFNPKGKSGLVIGAGGSARAVVYGLAKSGAASIAVANRHPEKAAALVRDFGKRFPKTSFQALASGRNELRLEIRKADLIVNATPVGLKPGVGPLMATGDIPRPVAGKKKVFYDLIYHRKTPFLKSAKARGHQAVDGLGMLLFQGALAFQYWTRRKAPVPVMKRALKRALKAS